MFLLVRPSSFATVTHARTRMHKPTLDYLKTQQILQHFTRLVKHLMSHGVHFAKWPWIFTRPPQWGFSQQRFSHVCAAGSSDTQAWLEVTRKIRNRAVKIKESPQRHQSTEAGVERHHLIFSREILSVKWGEMAFHWTERLGWRRRRQGALGD